MKNTRLINIVLILMLLLNAGFLGSWWYGHWKAHKMERMNYTHHGIDSKGAKCLVKQLNFNEAQQTQLETLRKEHFQKMGMLESAVARNEKNMMNAIMASPMDSAHAFLYADSIGIVKASMQKELFRHLADIKKVCTPDQISKFDELIKEMSNEFPHHFGVNGSNGAQHDSM
ncbi:MAG TPA: periplasmic heavy metal sensor [Bacteroidia bacterium]|jgi:Spy/CpxP family protein refolding chaperone|nr:periplasmic heavy metal sensor [Bacteroidia bacterium]